MAKPDEIRRIERIAWDLRADVVRMIGVGKAGHLGGSCSVAEIVAALYFAKMRFDPKALGDPCRDRFLLSKGHSVLIQYAALVELGVIPREELGKVKTLAGKLQGHPDMMTPGMEAVTGSLGQGLSIAVGMALALRLAKSPSRVYVVMGTASFPKASSGKRPWPTGATGWIPLLASWIETGSRPRGRRTRSSTSPGFRRNGGRSDGTR